jgi:hypothetical protein
VCLGYNCNQSYLLQKISQENEVHYSFPFSNMISYIQDAEVASTANSKDKFGST